MKKIIIVCGLVVGVSVAMMLIIFFLYSQVNYVNLINKKVSISDDDSSILVFDEKEEVVFNYSIEEWRKSAEELWPSYFKKPLEVGEKNLTASDFSKFVAVSAFPEGTKTFVFAVLFEGEDSVSLFWTLNIDTKEVLLIGDVNYGAIGNIIWSPEGNCFTYILNTSEVEGKYLTVDNTITRKKEFTLSRDAILKELNYESDDYYPEFRMMRWSEDGGILNFTTNGMVEERDIRWSITFNGEDLKIEN